MTRKPKTDDDRATLRQAADLLAIGLTDLLHDILRLASLMQSAEGEGDKPEYLEFCDREGPGCDCELACKHKPKHLLPSVRRRSPAQPNSATGHFEASHKIGHRRPTRRRVLQEESAG